MRTTLTLDDDVVARSKALTQRLGLPWKSLVNEALRRGLDALDQAVAPKAYSTRAQALGLREGLQLDNVQDLLARLDEDRAVDPG